MSRMFRSIVRSPLAGLAFLVALPHLGCRGTSTPSPQSAALSPDPALATAFFSEDLQATCSPPAAWEAKPIERLPRAIQHVWVSPTGRTAYGVMHVNLPLPVGPDLALWGFINEMRRIEGEGRLLTRQTLPGESGLRFVAESTRYRMRGVLRSRGMTAWVVYAGTLRAEPEMPLELELAERARERTQVGPPAP